MLTRKGRREAHACLAQGPHAVGEALGSSSRHRVVDLFVTAAAADREPDLLARARSAGATVALVSDAVLAKLDDTVTPQGVVAVVAAADIDRSYLADARLLAVLGGVADPGNAGTVIRSADAAGADGVLLTAGSADVWAPKAVRASAGSIFHLPVETGISAVDVTKLTVGAQLLLATTDGEVSLDDLLASGQLAAPTAWLFGNEAHGVPGDLATLATATVRIPIHPRAESLNLAAAAAVCLFASARAQAV